MRYVFRAGFRICSVVGLIAGLLSTATATAQTVSALAGNGVPGFNGDGILATSASLNMPYGVAVDAVGNRYIADFANFRIRKVAPNGVITTVAGNGNPGYSGDGGPATSASITTIFHPTVDAAGNLYLPDWDNHVIRKVTAAGIISTVAGSGVAGFSGDGGLAINATMMAPVAVATDADGNFYFSDAINPTVRKVTPGGIISTFAGNGNYGVSGDGGPATNATLTQPYGLAVDAAGALLIADVGGGRIRKVEKGGIITTVAGGAVSGFSGDGGSATAASLSNPWDVKVDGVGNIYIADAGNGRIRRVSQDGKINTFAGDGTFASTGDGGPAAIAQISSPLGLAIGGGNLYFVATFDNLVRKITLFDSCSAEGFSGRQLLLCRRICEVQQPSANLKGLIKTYTTLYSAPPPCAR